ncbi:MAG TPA: TonB-dependent receptor [Caulobacteraceae bacterium]
MRHPRSFNSRLMAGAAAAVLLLAAGGAAHAQTKPITIAPQALDTALSELGALSDRQVMVRADIASGKMSRGVTDAPSFEAALVAMLDGSGLTYRRSGNTYLIEETGSPQSGSAAGGGAEVEALIVTAQKREEDIQDVPIAISAFSAEALEEQKIEGGFDLLKAIPNVTFSKNNFSSYNFSIRGIGTKAVSATTDPGVAVSFNNIALIQNRLFEQEYFDVERVEVLRGPQGTLYGRNATAGVINVISAKPDMNEFKGWLKGEVGNYHAKRASAMVNVPLIEDKLAIRFAGAFTDRQGYDFNLTTGHAINGRDLWSARVTVGFNPTDNIRTNLIWERFNEDDNRSRTGKQLCHRDDGPEKLGNVALYEDPATDPQYHGELNPYRRAFFSQGCKPGSLYDPQAFGTPNGLALPFIVSTWVLSQLAPMWISADGTGQSFLLMGDPYAGRTQSTNMREFESVRDPIYRAKADLVQFNADIDLSEGLTLSSQTLYNKDEVYSSQDFSRFASVPYFQDTAGWAPNEWIVYDYSKLIPGGIFCDPQIGCSNTVAGIDLSQAKGSQFAQEIRLQSDWDGPVNFSAGANYTRFKALVDYYVFNNVLTLLATTPVFNRSFTDSIIDPSTRSFPCNWGGFNSDGSEGAYEYDDPRATCPYIDPNPLEAIDGNGHNYFRSKNPYKLSSAAAFGEMYWNVREDLKVTAGLRYTDDRKTFIPTPTQVLLSRGTVGAGTVNSGYPEKPAIKQHWGEWTGRLGVDWKPELSFTDQTLLYAFYSRGYKGGGANPPSPGYATADETAQQLLELGAPEWVIPIYNSFGWLPILQLDKDYEDVFRPEFVNAFEVGTKNTLLQGALTFNSGAFFYDYTDYQVSQIRDRTAVNENFDAQVWGLEFETAFAPTPNFRMIANLGYLDTRIADGMKSIDITNRTQSDPNWGISKPWLQLPSNCIVPTAVLEYWAATHRYMVDAQAFCHKPGGILGANTGMIWDPTLQKEFDIDDYPEANGGVGLWDDLSGNELPNSPHWTANIGAQYAYEFIPGWKATIRGDAYWQSQSWARVYNAVNDKLHGWYNANLSLWIENEEGLKIELYAKNILDEQPITDAFINSDDTALTTNVFTLDPRLIGLSIRKEF